MPTEAGSFIDRLADLDVDVRVVDQQRRGPNDALDQGLVNVGDILPVALEDHAGDLKEPGKLGRQLAATRQQRPVGRGHDGGRVQRTHAGGAQAGHERLSIDLIRPAQVLEDAGLCLSRRPDTDDAKNGVR